jgi:hypothetical protein
MIGLWVAALASTGQNAPQTAIGTLAAATQGAVNVTLSVSGFSDIGALYLSVDYDYEALQLTGVSPHPQIPGLLYGDTDLGDGRHRLTLGWYGNGLTLPDNSTLATLHFNFSGGYSELIFFDNGPSCAWSNSAGQNLNDLPFQDYYENGAVCGDLANPGPVFGPAEVCRGAGLCVFWVDPLANATGYTWTIPGDVEVLGGQNTNLVALRIGDDAESFTLAVSGSNPCGISGPAASLAVTVHELPVAVITSAGPVPWGSSATLQALAGGTGSYTYHWSPEEMFIDPDVQNPQTGFVMAGFVARLTVTDLATGCEATGQAAVQVAGGPLSANPHALPDSICAGAQAGLLAMEAGGSAQYTYSWISSPPGWWSDIANPTVEPEVTTTFILTLNDGFSTVTDSVTVWVDEPVTATISGSDTLCGDGDTTVLTVGLSGSPPWDLVYRYGSQSVFAGDIWETPFQVQAGSEGLYSVDYVRDRLCDGSAAGESHVMQVPVPPTPEITLYENTLVSNASAGNQWYHNDLAIPGATGVSYTATESGRYYTIVTLYGCPSDTSNTLLLVIPGMPEWPETSCRLYPNPARDHFFLSFTDWHGGTLTARILDLQGRERWRSEASAPAGPALFTFDPGGVPAGMYLLQTDDGPHPYRLVLLP